MDFPLWNLCNTIGIYFVYHQPKPIYEKQTDFDETHNDNKDYIF